MLRLAVVAAVASIALASHEENASCFFEGAREVSGGCNGTFEICHSGNIVLGQCPKSMVFNGRRGVCDYKSESSSCLEKDRSWMKAKKAPVFTCASVYGDGPHLPHSHAVCSRTYIICMHGVAIEFGCSPMHFFDPYENICRIDETCSSLHESRITPCSSLWTNFDDVTCPAGFACEEISDPSPSGKYSCRYPLDLFYGFPGFGNEDSWVRATGDLQCHNGIWFDGNSMISSTAAFCAANWGSIEVGQGRSMPDGQARILRGEDVIDFVYERLPFIVEITKQVESAEKSQCGGTLIARDLVLSAAHCMTKWSLENNYYAVRTGSKLSLEGKRHEIKDWVFHSDWKEDNNDDVRLQTDDLVMIRISPGVDEGEYFNLQQKPPKEAKKGENQNCFTMGWGNTEKEDYPKFLQMASFNEIKHGFCYFGYNRKAVPEQMKELQDERLLCMWDNIHQEAERATPGTGDSGAPLYCLFGRDFHLQGVLIGGDNDVSTYNKLSYYSKHGWIKDARAILERQRN